MKRFPLVIGFALLAIASCTAQTQAPADPYKPVLDRLQATTTMPLEMWKIVEGDPPHGETPVAPVVNTNINMYKQDFPLPSWLYATAEVPAALNGYSIAGSQAALKLNIGGNTGVLITVFVNGNMVARGDEDSQGPINLTQNAQPGQKLLIAVRVLPSGTVGCCG